MATTQTASNPYDQFGASNPYDQFDATPTPSPAPVSPSPKEQVWHQVGDYAGKTIANVIPSLGDYAEGLYETVRHPINTVENLGDLAYGGVQAMEPKWLRVLPYDPHAALVAHRVAKFYENRYGSLPHLMKTIEDDPVGFLADLSTVASGGGALAHFTADLGDPLKAAAASEKALSGVEDIDKTGALLKKVGERAKKTAAATNPISAAGKSLGFLGRTGRSIYTEVTGLGTGSGPGAIREVMEASPEVKAAFRGNISEPEVMEKVYQGLNKVEADAKANYEDSLRTISKDTKPIDMQPIKEQLVHQLMNYHIRVVEESDGVKLDFTHSTISNPSAQTDITTIANDIVNWHNSPGWDTPIGLDVLKQRVANTYSENSQARAFSQHMAEVIRTQLQKNVPGYAEMSADYQNMKNFTKEFQTAFSTRNKAAIDTAIRRLLTGMREEGGSRRLLLKELDYKTGQNLSGYTAGLLMKPKLARRLIPILLLGTDSFFFKMIAQPLVMGATLGMASPRIVAEVTYHAAKLLRAAGYRADQISAILKQMKVNADTMNAVQRANTAAERPNG